MYPDSVHCCYATKIIETTRLFLRRIQDSDVAALGQVFGSPEVMRFGEGVQGEEWVRGWIRECENSYRTSNYGPWAVVEKDSEETIGYCEFFHFPDICGKEEIEIGYRLAFPYWGLGFATEAVLAVRDYGFEELGLNRIISIIDPGNLASIRVAEKAGIRLEKEVILDGYTHPDQVYVIQG